MILFIITDSKENARGEGFYRTSFVLEDHAEDACAVFHYRHVTPELVGRLQPWAICHSGCSANYEENHVLTCQPYLEVITQVDLPQIGFCGGHQIIAHAFGSPLDHIRRLRDDEPDPAGYNPGWFKEWGAYPVRIVQRDPLFEGFGEVLRVYEYHRDEVKELSAPLRLLASTDTCRVQAFVHAERPIYGTQFHPEAATKDYPDGFGVLKNFFGVARGYGKARGRS